MAITPWEVPTAGDDSASAPLRERFVDAIDNRLDHVREGTYDPSTHRPHSDRPHDHCGECSERLPSTAVPNMLLFGTGTTGWTLSGATSSSNGLTFTASGQSAGRTVLGSATASRLAFGGGCPLRLAILARIAGFVTGGSLEFGLADDTSFATGAKGVVDIATLTTSYRRLGIKIASFSALGHVTDTKVRVATTAWSGVGGVQVTLVYLRPLVTGDGWSYWQPGCLEFQHNHWANTAATPAALYDQDRDFTNATEVTPV